MLAIVDQQVEPRLRPEALGTLELVPVPDQGLHQCNVLHIEGAVGVVGDQFVAPIEADGRADQPGHVPVTREDDLVPVQVLNKIGDHVIALDPGLGNVDGTEFPERFHDAVPCQPEGLVGLRGMLFALGLVPRVNPLAQNFGGPCLRYHDHVRGH